MPFPRVFGIETEYGYTHLPGDGVEVPREIVLAHIDRLSREIAPCVRSVDGRGIFLANGGRFYLDMSDLCDKPEFATAECSDPIELLTRIEEADAFVNDLAGRVEKEIGGDMLFSKTNVDYASGNTWGCHENYLIRRGYDLEKNLVPFLCSRQILAGSGGFDSSGGLHFSLSTRAPFMRAVTGIDTLRQRAILNTRDESHSRSFEQRIHLIVGEGLHGEISSLLKCGTTALVAGLIEAGVEPGQGIGLRAPLSAIRRFAQDPSCTTAARAESGRLVSPIDIQRHYLRLAGDHLSKLPVWSEAVCRLWTEVLDNLESGREQNELLRLDWVIRYRLFNGHLRKTGHDLSTLPQPEMPNYTELSRELWELDTKFGRVGPKGVFHLLNAQGCLQHRIDPGPIPRESAATRASLRGLEIQKACRAGKDDTILADWSGLYDTSNDQELNLFDPLQTSAAWTARAEGQTTAASDSWLRRLRFRPRAPF